MSPLSKTSSQLTLSVVPDDGSTSAQAIARLRARLRLDGPTPALVHLRCSVCAAVRTLRLAAPGRARPSRVERMLPRVPVRHWVFSLGESAQPRLLAAPRLRTKVARACIRAVFSWLRRAAVRASVPGSPRCGAVAAIHRVGAALDANVHVHALVLDGVYVLDADASPVFHPLPPPRRRDLRRVVSELRHAVDELLARAPSPGPSASTTRSRVTHRIVTGPVVRPVCSPPPEVALVQRCGELDVRAGPPVPADDRMLRARLCRYVGRPPFDPTALDLGDHGRLRYRLHHPFSDGTTHVELSPAEMAERLQRLASGELRPPLSFHGVLAPGAVTGWLELRGSAPRQLSLLEPSPRSPASPRSSSSGLRCPRCEGTLEIIGVEPAGRRAA